MRSSLPGCGRASRTASIWASRGSPGTGGKTGAGKSTVASLIPRLFDPWDGRVLIDGQNVADVQLAVAKRGGRVPFRPVVVRTIAAAATLGSGGSAGSEGPVAVLGAATGSAVGSSSGFPPRRVKILTACGAAAGIAAAFNAPFAGAFFALEEVLGSFSAGAFSPVVIASAIAAVITQSVFGASPTVDVPATEITGLLPIVLVLPVFGVLCGAVSALYTRTFFRCDELAKGMRDPPWLVPVWTLILLIPVSPSLAQAA